jgi:CubicO group peptidase (beta-lactamase class C family)
MPPAADIERSVVQAEPATAPEAATQPLFRTYQRAVGVPMRVKSSTAVGLAEPGRPLAAQDPARIASISKYIVLLGVLRLVEAGTLDLDRDVNAWLDWDVQSPSGQPVTLRHLLSHRSGLTDANGYVVPLGTDLATFLGAESWNGAAPGERFEYSNLGFAVIASTVEAATNERFDTVMQREVMTPLGLDICFNWGGCRPDTRARGVELRAPDGTRLRDDFTERMATCQVYRQSGPPCDLSGYRPGANGSLFSPQGGVRASAVDLARIGGEVLDPDSEFLSDESWLLLFAAEPTGDPIIRCFGLGVEQIGGACGNDLFGDGRVRFGHAGDAYHVRSGLWMDAAAGEAVAYVLTGVPSEAGDEPKPFSEAEILAARGLIP